MIFAFDRSFFDFPLILLVFILMINCLSVFHVVHRLNVFWIFFLNKNNCFELGGGGGGGGGLKKKKKPLGKNKKWKKKKKKKNLF